MEKLNPVSNFNLFVAFGFSQYPDLTCTYDHDDMIFYDMMCKTCWYVIDTAEQIMFTPHSAITIMYTFWSGEMNINLNSVEQKLFALTCTVVLVF